MFYNGLYTLFRHKYLIFVLLLWGCSSDAVIENDPDEVAVTFSTGSSATLTRADFPTDTPVKIFVYRRVDGSNPNYSVAPYKTVEGKTAGGAVAFTGGDITSNNLLTVRRGYTYDFIVVVDASPNATIDNLKALTLTSGVLTGFSHGRNILSGCNEGNVIGTGTTTASVSFGDLPHLYSAVYTEVQADQKLLDVLHTIEYKVVSAEFRQCLPDSARLAFGSPVALTVNNEHYDTSYKTPGSDLVTATVTTDVATSANGFLLPYPLRYKDRAYNVVDINFRIEVKGVEVIFYAPGIQLGAFQPDYRYKFIVVLDEGNTLLKLSIEPWSTLSWDAGMGDDSSYAQITLGSWATASWEMGIGDESQKLVPPDVSGFTTVSWTSQMGD